LVERTLRTAKTLGQVAIVTLADRSWFLESASLLLGLDFSALLVELDIDVFYAREEDENPCSRKDFLACKRACMVRCMNSWKNAGAFDASSPLSMLSIGDSNIERDALRSLAENPDGWGLDDEPPLCKTLKLMEEPTLQQLSDELNSIIRWLGRLACSSSAFDVTVTDPSQLNVQTLGSL